MGEEVAVLKENPGVREGQGTNHNGFCHAQGGCTCTAGSV